VIKAKSDLGIVKNLEFTVNQALSEREIDEYLYQNSHKIFQFFESIDPTSERIEILSAQNESRYYHSPQKKSKISLVGEDDLRESVKDETYLNLLRHRLKRGPRQIDKTVDYLFGFKMYILTDPIASQEIFSEPRRIYSELEKIRSISEESKIHKFEPEFRPLSNKQEMLLISEKGCNPDKLKYYKEGIIELPRYFNKKVYDLIVEQANTSSERLSLPSAKKFDLEETEILKAKALPGIWIDHFPKDTKGSYIETILQTKDFFKIYTGKMSHETFYEKYRAENRRNNYARHHLDTVETFMREWISMMFPKPLLQKEIYK
jgi:hypothetical protein